MPIRSLKILATLASSILLALWLMQHNIEQYWQQTYYRQSPLAALQNNALWRSGGILKQQLTRLLGAGESSAHIAPPPAAPAITVSAPTTSTPAIASSNDDDDSKNAIDISELDTLPNPASALIPTAAAATLDVLPADETVAADETTEEDDSGDEAIAEAPAPGEKAPIRLGEGDRVLLIGDSMMQSLAPHIQRELLARHHIKSINRGKPSSGLRFPGYYNWPENLASQLEENPDVRLIIVLLGANDPQDTPDPANPKRYMHFGTPEWEAYYRGEIRKILQTAAARGAQTLWIGPPLMKAGRYSKKVTYLDQLIAEEVENAQQHYQNTNRLFAKADGSYTAFLADERGKTVAVRKGDGIHFTGAGEKILTRHIIEQINP